MSRAMIPQPDTAIVDSVVARLVQGEHERQIEADVSQEMVAAQRETLFAAVADRLRAAAKCDRDVAVGFALEAYRKIYADAKAMGDLAAARGAIKDWVTLALRHNVLDDEDSEEVDEQGEATDAITPEASRDGKPPHQGRRTKTPRKPQAPRRVSAGVRRPRASKAT